MRRPASGPPSLSVEIDELVLEGFGAREGRAVGEAVRRELERLIVERGLPPSLASGAVDRVDAGSLRLGANAPVDRTARGIAGAVYAALGREAPGTGARREARGTASETGSSSPSRTRSGAP